MILAAAATPFYRAPERRGLLRLAPAAAAALSSIPVTSIERFLTIPEQFRNPFVPRRGTRSLRYPLPGKPRVAVLCDGITEDANTRVFAMGWTPEIAAFRPEALAGDLESLRTLADLVLEGIADLPTLVRPIIAFSGLPFLDFPTESSHIPALTAADRNLFWQAFGAPVYEQWLGIDNEVLAEECDAHCGLHLAVDRAIFELCPDLGGQELVVTSFENLAFPVLRLGTGIHAIISTEPCECGKPGPRLVAVPTLGRRSIASTAAD
jgi:hypothetical protein